MAEAMPSPSYAGVWVVMGLAVRRDWFGSGATLQTARVGSVTQNFT
ncbi:MAG: hypothetical protein ABSC15_14450 [Terriglobales bacterium]